jgi:hypothetical protein
VKPAPLNLAELIVTGAVPVEVNVTGCTEAEFTVTLPNVKLAELIVSCGLGTAVPVPLRFTTAVLLIKELLLIVSRPTDVPAAIGSNCISSVAAWPGFNVSGSVAPKMVKPPPVSIAALIVTGAVPVDVNVTGCVEAEFTVTFPNVKFAELIVNCGLGAAVPRPLRLTTAVLLVEELLWMVSWPAAGPVVDGSNWTLSVTAWPGFRVAGKDNPEIAKPQPVSVAELIVNGAVPVDVNVTGCVNAVPTATLPNIKLPVLTFNARRELLLLIPDPLIGIWVTFLAAALVTVNWPE